MPGGLGSGKESWIAKGDPGEVINILGAGISGLSAAINLAQAGYTVNIFEKRRKIGGKYRGDLQGIENWSGSLDFRIRLGNQGIRRNFDLKPLRQVMVTNGFHEVKCHFKRPVCYLVRRGPLPGTIDRGLASQAMDLGVHIQTGTRIPPQRPDIIATGFAHGRSFGIVKGVSFQTGMDDVAIVVLGDSVAYRGYAYLLVASGLGCLCVAVMGRYEQSETHFHRAKEIISEMVDLDMENPKDVTGFGSFSARTIFQREGRLCVGEAAGLQDLLWGFGIKKAMISGYLAARSIIENEDYEGISTEVLGNGIKAGIVNRLIWEAFHLDDYSLFIDILRRIKDPVSLFRKTHTYTPIHRMLYPLARSYLNIRYPHLAAFDTSI